MLITNQGTIIRTPIADIPVYSRIAAGVIVMRLNEGAMIVNTAIVTPFEGDGAADAEAEEEKEE